MAELELERFVATLNATFTTAILAKPLVVTPGGIVGLTPEQVIQIYNDAVAGTLRFIAANAP